MAAMDFDLVKPFQLSIPETELEDLQRRLQNTRWPDREPVNDWSQGVPLAKVQELCEYWRETYDWRRCEAMLNNWNQYHTTIDGVKVHFLHIRSPEPDALPMIMTHGWPGSVLEFNKVIGLLTDPVAHGGRAVDAFHLILPSLPGYGFSRKPTETGWGFVQIANAWGILMERLGYHHYVAQGGDWGADVTASFASNPPSGLAAVHLSTAFFNAKHEIRGQPSAAESKAAEMQQLFEMDEYGYFKIQGTRPQTVGYGLADSPAGQAAWIYEKISKWSQHSGDVESILSKDEILDNIMLYWLPNAATSSARQYWENEDNTALPIKIPVGVSLFPGDQYYATRTWGERYYENIIHWKDVEKGGHFAAWEVPEIFLREVRDCFRSIHHAKESK